MESKHGDCHDTEFKLSILFVYLDFGKWLTLFTIITVYILLYAKQIE